MTDAPRTPASRGYRMPAEWERHEATWLSWPYNAQTWGDHLDGAEAAFGEIVATLSHHENVYLLCANEGVQKRATAKLDATNVDMNRVAFHRIESGDVWIRDYGPLFLVKDGSPKEYAWTKWIYNAYGNKYEDLLIGNEVANHMPLGRMPRFDTGMVLEGGSIDVNGSGTLLTTESCLLSHDRNPDLSKADIEKKLKEYLGVTNVLWLSEGIEGDDTTGHVDDLTRFVGQSTVMTVLEEDPLDANYKPLMENAKRLTRMKDEKGNPLNVLTVPMPKPLVVESRRMAASYANFYIANGVVLVPTYAQPSDDEAITVLTRCFPERKIVGIDCRELIWGYGSIHCATQQQPL